jgi:hypothetical protein
MYVCLCITLSYLKQQYRHQLKICRNILSSLSLFLSGLFGCHVFVIYSFCSSFLCVRPSIAYSLALVQPSLSSVLCNSIREFVMRVRRLY